jgi:cysteine synthase/rhodanese-related sulfurtransferase
VADHTLRVYENMLAMLSSADNPTPLVQLNKVSPFKHTKVFVKLEWYNPFGAVKDRVAANLINDAESRGTVGQVKKLVEPTSGNTGMGLAMMANLKGYSLTTPLSNGIPQEKRTVLRFFGCDVIELDDSLCPAPGQPEGAMQMAADLGAKPDFHQLNQYVNPANPEAHFKTTGPEIWRQTGGKVTHFVAGLGTCGTITGTGRFLKQQDAAVKVMGVHPAEGHDIPGVRSLRQLKLTEFYLPREYDQQVEVDNEEAYSLCLRLNREEGIIAGPSSGMALAGAFKMVPDEPGNIVVVIFPDNIFKYATSVARHFPKMFPAAPADEATDGGASSEEAQLVRALLDNARRSPDVIDMGEVMDLIDSDERPLFVDVRTPAEFAEGHIEGAVNVPLDALGDKAAGLPKDKDAPIVTVCNVGRVSLTGMLILKSLGYHKVKNLMGGLNSWVSEGNPLET